jgi:predicted NUDIX family NTP pyrophosphohydrolase
MIESSIMIKDALMLIAGRMSGELVDTRVLECNCDVQEINSNTFEIEWPPKSVSIKTFPEIDKAAWFTIDMAKQKIMVGQLPLLKELETKFITA